jgi:hypothetical protein
MSDVLGEDDTSAGSTAAFDELRGNLDYARDLVRGGRYLERLKVGAFDVADLYRAAWVQAVSALDHWVHRELYDRALGLAMQMSVQRPARFLQIEIPMRLFEDVQRGSTTLREAFQSHLRSQFGYQSFQAPEKIKQALGYVRDGPLWPAVADQFNAGTDRELITSEQVQDRLSKIVKRRNRIAHEADRDMDRPGTRNPISDTEATETIDWIEQAASAILAVLGPPPASVDAAAATGGHDTPSGQQQQARPKWTRRDIDDAVARLSDLRGGQAARRLLAHADAREALFRGGVSPEPSAGLYYWLQGARRSLWSLYLTADRPQVALNFGSVWPRDSQVTRRMVAEIRRSPALDAALLHSDEDVVRKYPSIDLTVIAQSPDAVDAIIRALDLVDQTQHHGSERH